MRQFTVGLGKLPPILGGLEDGLHAQGFAHAQEFFTNPWMNLSPAAEK